VGRGVSLAKGRLHHQSLAILAGLAIVASADESGAAFLEKSARREVVDEVLHPNNFHRLHVVVPDDRRNTTLDVLEAFVTNTMFVRAENNAAAVVAILASVLAVVGGAVTDFAAAAAGRSTSTMAARGGAANARGASAAASTSARVLVGHFEGEKMRGCL
jgi:hypothetical protein